MLIMKGAASCSLHCPKNCKKMSPSASNWEETSRYLQKVLRGVPNAIHAYLGGVSPFELNGILDTCM